MDSEKGHVMFDYYHGLVRDVLDLINLVIGRIRLFSSMTRMRPGWLNLASISKFAISVAPVPNLLLFQLFCRTSPTGNMAVMIRFLIIFPFLPSR